MIKFAICFLMMLGMSLTSNNLSAKPHLSRLPAQYPLKKITISISYQPGAGIPGGYQMAVAAAVGWGLGVAVVCEGLWVFRG